MAQQGEACRGGCGCEGCEESVETPMEGYWVTGQGAGGADDDGNVECSQRRSDDCFLDALPVPVTHRYHHLVESMDEEEQALQRAVDGIRAAHGSTQNEASEMASAVLRWGGPKLLEA